MLSNMEDICKICEKNGRLFITHSFTNSIGEAAVVDDPVKPPNNVGLLEEAVEDPLNKLFDVVLKFNQS